jgi:DNA-binding transcriptional regulator YiaG
MNPDEFREALARLNLSQGALARLFRHLGDPAEAQTIRTRVERWASGKARVSGEAVAMLGLFRCYPNVLADLLAALAKTAPKRKDAAQVK